MARKGKRSQTRKRLSRERFEPLATPTEETDLRAKLMVILRDSVDALGGSAGVIALWSEKERQFIEGATYGLDPKDVERLRPLLKEAIFDLAASRQNFDQLSHLAPDVASIYHSRQEFPTE